MGRIALVVAGAAAFAAASGFAVNKPWRPRHGPTTFSISGHVDGLAPGKRSALAVRVANPWSRTIRVRSVNARVGPSGRPCAVRNVRVSGFRGSLVVPPRTARMLVLQATLRSGAPAACAGAAFPLRFSGRAVVR